MAAAAGMGVKLKGFVREEAFTHCMGEGAVTTPWVSMRLPPTLESASPPFDNDKRHNGWKA